LTQFREDFWGKDFLCIPENQKIATLLEKSKKGLVFRGIKTTAVKRLLTELIAAAGTRRVILLLEMLMNLASVKPFSHISSAYHRDNLFTQSERINTIYNYTLQHFKSTIYIKDIAALTSLTTNSFCRYFKSCTRKSYTQFIAELRIGHACKLLSEGQKSIKEVCYESGFHNITHFNRLFKKMKSVQPGEYRKMINS
jgi:AraC-like DNA-binding protein